jgi:uncharacterized protein YndB with AHSA1/START domain
MRRFETSIDLAVPPARVWAVMCDIERWHEWTPSITSVRRLDDGAVRVGSRARVKQPKLPASVFEITVWNPERGFDWVTRSPGLQGLGSHVIEPIANGSRVTLSVTFSGPLTPVATFFFGGLTGRYIRMEAEGLKRRAQQP